MTMTIKMIVLNSAGITKEIKGNPDTLSIRVLGTPLPRMGGVPERAWNSPPSGVLRDRSWRV